MPPRLQASLPPARHFIREWRQAKGWTLQQLADAIGSTKGHMSVVENHKAGLTPSAAALIAQALDVDVSSLLSNMPGEGPSAEDEWIAIFRGADSETRTALLTTARAIAGLGRKGGPATS